MQLNGASCNAAAVNGPEQKFLRLMVVAVSGAVTNVRRALAKSLAYAVFVAASRQRLLPMLKVASANGASTRLSSVLKRLAASAAISSGVFRSVKRQCVSTCVAAPNRILKVFRTLTASVSVAPTHLRGLFKTMSAHAIGYSTTVKQCRVRMVAIVGASAGTAKVAMLNRSAELFNSLETSLFAARQRTAGFASRVRSSLLRVRK